MPILYHSVEPESNRSTFTEHNTVSFVINSDRNLVRNSIRLEGKITVNSTGAQRAAIADGLCMNKRVGCHSVLDSAQTSLAGNVIENISQDYARFVNMIESAQNHSDSYYNSAQLCELKAPSTSVAIGYAAGDTDNTNAGDAANDMDFSFKPLICLNRMSGDLQLSKYNNEVRLNFNLARQVNVLSGGAQVDATNYSISDLRLTYSSSDPEPVGQVQMRRVIPIKQLISTSNASVNTRVPGVCDAVSISFLNQAQENQNKVDTLSLQNPMNIEEVGFTFNDSTNALQQYSQDEYGEYVEGYIKSLKTAGIHGANPNSIGGNSVFGLGLDFTSDVDLSNQKFGVSVRSGINAAYKFIVYLYFHSKIVV